MVYVDKVHMSNKLAKQEPSNNKKRTNKKTRTKKKPGNKESFRLDCNGSLGCLVKVTPHLKLEIPKSSHFLQILNG